MKKEKKNTSKKLILESQKLIPNQEIKNFIIKKIFISTKRFSRFISPVRVFLAMSGHRYHTTITCSMGKKSFISHAEADDIYSSISTASNRLKTRLFRENAIMHARRPAHRSEMNRGSADNSYYSNEENFYNLNDLLY